MPAGRYDDGLYSFEQIYNALEHDFLSEKEMVDYIELNIHLFCEELLGVKYQSHIREYRIDFSRLRGNKSQRLDLLITDQQERNILIECKKPKYVCENQAAIGQILAYKELCKVIELPVYRTILVTTKLDALSVMVLNNNNLGIELIGFDKSKSLTLTGRNGQ